eukprot:2127417-Ditylum_brightwellii.AAC.1
MKQLVKSLTTASITKITQHIEAQQTQYAAMTANAQNMLQQIRTVSNKLMAAHKQHVHGPQGQYPLYSQQNLSTQESNMITASIGQHKTENA